MKRFQLFVAILSALLLVSCKGDPKVSRDEFFQSGERFFAEERYREAIIQYRNALQIEEGYLPASLAVARAFQKTEDHRNAVSAYQKVLSLDGSNAEAKLELGKYYLQGGAQNPDLYEEARKMAEELLEINPDNIQAHILLGNTYAGLNDLESSVKTMRMVLEEDPENLVARLNLGAFQLKLADTEKAEAVFLEALALHPESPSVHRALGNFYLFTKDLDKARQYFTQAFSLDTSDQTSVLSLVRFNLMNSDLEAAEAVFKQAAAEHPDQRESLSGLANLYVATGRIDQAIEVLTGLLAEDSGDRRTMLQLGELYLKNEQPDRATELVDRLLKSDDRDAEAHYLRGRFLLASGDEERALESFTRAVELKDWLIPAYLQQASILMSRRELPAARKALEAVLRVNRNHLPANAGLAKILALDRKPEEALERADAVLEVRPGNVDALTARGESLLMLRRLEGARAAFTKLAELQPGTAFHHHRLGSIAALEGKREEALKHFREALRINPDLPQVMNDILFVHMQAGRFDEAFREVEGFQASRKDLLEVFRGKIRMAQEDPAGATRHLQEAIRLNRENYEAYILLGQLHVQQGNLPQAIREVDELLAENSGFAPAHLLKAYYLDLSKDPMGAVQHYKAALALDAKNAIAANNLAWLYCTQDQNLDEALSLASVARRQDPENPQYADTLGWIYYKMNNYTLAVDQLLFSVNNGRPGAGNYFRLGMAYYRKGNPNLARQSLRKALEMEPAFPGEAEARRVLAELG